MRKPAVCALGGRFITGVAALAGTSTSSVTAFALTPAYNKETHPTGVLMTEGNN